MLCSREEDVVVYGYSDASNGSDAETKRSRSGFMFKSGGAVVSWGSKVQEVVALCILVVLN